MRKNYNMVGYGSIGLVSFIILALLFPVVRQEAAASDAKVDNRTAVSQIGLALTEQQVWEVDPSAEGGTATMTTSLVVSAGGTSGYKLYIYSKDGKSSLSNTDASVEAEISAIEGESTLASFPINTWGYNLSLNSPTSETLYQAVSSTPDALVLEKTTEADAVDYYNLSFATKVDTTLPAGAYTGDVIVTLVATPKAQFLSELTYMQGMTTEICTNTPSGSTKRLTDIRDGKSYWVAKLADGNCWMTQNLALDLDTNENGKAVAVSQNGTQVELNSSNTDITNPWQTYAPTKTETEIPLANSQDAEASRSWNFGEIVLNEPINGSNCDSVTTGQKIAVTCSSVFTDVSNGWTAGYTATETSAVNVTGRSYDAHFLLGNYYSWNAVTAGSGAGLVSPSSSDTNPNDLVDAPYSICPKGWRLPVGGRYYSGNVSYPYERSKSFAYLLIFYGYPRGNAGAISPDGWTVNNGAPRTMIVGSGKTRVDYKPIYLFRSGSVSPESGKYYSGGGEGSYWSATVADSRWSVYALYMNSNVVIMSGGTYNRFNGIAARCVAK